MSEALSPGLMVIHGNHPEALRDLLVAWMARYPLAPLESETILVQSNGIAQWLKLALGRDVADGGCGITAALDVQLPAQFLWRAYRGALGKDQVPEVSVLDKAPLTWRLMRLLPTLLAREEFQALRRFLADDADLRKRYQLAERLADLFDQYQVYRADWLEDWSEHRDQLRTAGGNLRPLNDDERWQAELWRALLAEVGEDGLAGSRAGVHRRFLERLREGAPPKGLPRRVVVFGISAMPAQTVEALAALAQVAQVLLCVHNPCRHHWADIVADKDLLRHEYRRQQRRPGVPLQLDDDLQHQYAQPLLAAWGKQGRDYINLLDQYDNPESYRSRFGEVSGGRIDLFSEESPAHLLGQLQDDILELRPLAETRAQWPALEPARDRSIRFHLAHSAQREVEVLHDQLLARFDADPTLRPRDVIVMVPDIDAYAPHIQAVFGQLGRDDRRFIPFTLADQGQRGREPLLVALEHLLQLPDSRFAVSEILDLLDVGALRARFGIGEADLPLLQRWIDGAGVRWGLDGGQREDLGLPAAEEANTWRFGLRRMLLGFAVGEGEAFQGIQPYAEIGGLDAAVLGPLAGLLQRLAEACERLAEPAPPEVWRERLRQLLDDFFLTRDEHDELLRQQLLQLLERWLETCGRAAFGEPLPLSVVREAWLGGLDAGGLNQRFLAGAVSFCTLMPMRAIPFRVVCLLGMNDGDYPRQQPPLDFDLMRNDYRPGDRSRREDDRYLLLEAVLSARDQLYVSWVGRSIRDNSERPPSVLIGQLRDHLAAGWSLAGQPGDGKALLHALTTEHPLQPFSRRYFEGRGEGVDGFYTYAREWREVHRDDEPVEQAEAPLPELLPDAPIGLRVLADFLASPVNAFFQQRLKVRFAEEDLTGHDEETFALDGLQVWQLQFELCERLRPWIEQHWADGELPGRIEGQLARLRGEGRLPLAAFGAFSARELSAPLGELLTRYHEELEHWSEAEEGQREFIHSHAASGMELGDWLGGLRRNAEGQWASVQLVSGKLHEGRGYKWHSLVRHWVRHLGLQLCGAPVRSLLVSQTGTLELPPLSAEIARGHLDALITAWLEGLRRPLPVACKAAFAWLGAAGDEARAASEAAKRYDGGFGSSGEAAASPALARVYPDFASLSASGEFASWAENLYGPLYQLLQRRDDEEQGQ